MEQQFFPYTEILYLLNTSARNRIILCFRNKLSRTVNKMFTLYKNRICFLFCNFVVSMAFQRKTEMFTNKKMLPVNESQAEAAVIAACLFPQRGTHSLRICSCHVQLCAKRPIISFSLNNYWKRIYCEPVKLNR